MKSGWRSGRVTRVTDRKTKSALRFEAEARFGEAIKFAPKQAIDGYHRCRHHHGCGEEQMEVAAVGGLRDGRAEGEGRVDVSLEMKIFGDDAGIPRAPGGGHHAGDEIRKNSREDQFFPTRNAREIKDGAGFF